MKKKVSLKDIAQIVGVSIPLVSYVLGGKGKENRVSEETAEKIREVAKELNYHPNLNARSLKTNKTNSIGVIVADISNPFFANLARIIEDEAFLRDYTVIFGSSDEKSNKFNKVLDFLMTRQVDGLIIAAPEGSEDSIKNLIKMNYPLVLIDRYFKNIETNNVTVDNYKASIQITNHLLNMGHKNIATVRYDSELSHYDDRSNGYLDALKLSGIEKNEALIKRINVFNIEKEIRKSLKELLLIGNIDAIYFQTNTLAAEGLKQLLKINKAMLSQLDIVVFDKNLAFQFLDNKIPYMEQPLKKIGQKALNRLIDLIEDKKTDVKIEHINFTAKLNKTY